MKKKDKRNNIFLKIRKKSGDEKKKKIIFNLINKEQYKQFVLLKFLSNKSKNSLLYKSFAYIGFLQLNSRNIYKLNKKSYYRILKISLFKSVKKIRNRRLKRLKYKRRIKRFGRSVIRRNTLLQKSKRKRMLRRRLKKRRKLLLERKTKYSKMYRRLKKYKKRKKVYRYFFKRNVFYYTLKKTKRRIFIKKTKVLKLSRRQIKKKYKQQLLETITNLKKRSFKQNIKYVKTAKRTFLNQALYSLKSARIRKRIFRRYFLFHKRIRLFKFQKVKRKRIKRLVNFLQHSLKNITRSKKRSVIKIRKKRKIQKRKRRLFSKLRQKFRKSLYLYRYLNNQFGFSKNKLTFNLRKKWWKRQIKKYKKKLEYKKQNNNYLKLRLKGLNKKIVEKLGRKFLLKVYNKRMPTLLKRALKANKQVTHVNLEASISLVATETAKIIGSDITKLTIVKLLLLSLFKNDYFLLSTQQVSKNILDINTQIFNNNLFCSSNIVGFSNLGLKMITYMLKLKWVNKKLYRRLKERMLMKSDKYSCSLLRSTGQKQKLYLPKIKYNFVKLSKYFEEFKKLKYILKRKGKKTRGMYLMFNKLNEIYQYKVRRLGKKYYFLLRKDKLPKIGLFVLNYLKRNMYITLLNKKTKRVLGSTTARKNYLAKKQLEQEEELLKDNDSVGLSKDLVNLKMRAGTYIKKKKHRINVLLNTLEAVHSNNYSVLDLCIKIKYKRRFLVNFLNFNTYDYKGFIRMIQVAHQKPHGFMRKKKARRL